MFVVMIICKYLLLNYGAVRILNNVPPTERSKAMPMSIGCFAKKKGLVQQALLPEEVITKLSDPEILVIHRGYTALQYIKTIGPSKTTGY